MPQIFQAVHEYQVTHNGTSSNLCDTLEILRSPLPTEDDVICTVVSVLSVLNTFSFILFYYIFCGLSRSSRNTFNNILNNY